MNNQKKVDPETLLDMINTQAHTQSYDLAMGISTQFVTALIKAGHIRDVKSAADSLFKGNEVLQAQIQKELVALSLEKIEASMPKEQVPGVTPNVPANA